MSKPFPFALASAGLGAADGDEEDGSPWTAGAGLTGLAGLPGVTADTPFGGPLLFPPGELRGPTGPWPRGAGFATAVCLRRPRARP